MRKGISFVPILVIVLAVAVFGTVAYLAWQNTASNVATTNTTNTNTVANTNNNDTVLANSNTSVNADDTPLNTNEATNTNSDEAQSDSKMVTIKEWNVEFTMNSSISGLQYEISASDPSFARFSTTELIKRGCPISEAPLGGIARYKTKARSGAYVQMGGYYYYYVSPQATCSSDPDVVKLQTTARNIFQTALPQ